MSPLAPARHGDPTPAGRGALSGDLATLRRLRAYRQRREQHFPGLPDPAWDMLVDLALNTGLGVRVSVTSARLASFVPATTALRHISLLTGEGLVERIADPEDGRRVFLELTVKGALAVSNFLTDYQARAA